MTDIKTILEKCLRQQHLTDVEMIAVMHSLMNGLLTPAQISALLIALRMKGETVTEIAAAAAVMRELAVPVKVIGSFVDIVGTGGDGASIFNISTTASFIAAAAGAKVAKHGNRSVSSSTGSADVLTTAGANLTLTPEQIAICIDEIGIGFMFAPNHHQSMKHVVNVRKELAVRTLFNLLGPLTNPAGAKHHLIGVYDKQWLRPFAEVLQRLGSEHALIVHGRDGLDEITLQDKTLVAELKQDKIFEYEIDPTEFGINLNSLNPLKVANSQESLLLMENVFTNNLGPARDIVVLNAGAAIYAADLTQTITDGIELAKEMLASGKALEKFKAFIALTQTLNK